MEKFEPRIFVKTPSYINEPIAKLSLKRKNGANYEIQRVQSDDSDDDLPISLLVPLEKSEPINTTVTCGNCHKRVDSTLWPQHQQIHYGLGWRLETNDRPFDLDDRHLVLETMERFKADNNLSVFVCPNCAVERDTALQISMHIELCDLEKSKQKCEHCNEQFMPYALQHHVENGECPNYQMPENYTCGNCMCTVAAQDWPQHVILHYGIAWRLGTTDRPIDLTDTDDVMSIIDNFRMVNNVSELVCEYCATKRKRTKVYVLHLEKCEARLRPPNDDQSMVIDEGDLIIKLEIDETNDTRPELENAQAQVFTCGNCQRTLSNNDWLAHLKFHNGLAWKVGVQPPINLTDRNEVLSALKQFIKKYRINSMQCDKCNVVRKSAAGLYGHIIKCGSEGDDTADDGRVECQICSKFVPVASIENHQTACGKRRREKVAAEQRAAEKRAHSNCGLWTEELVNRVIHVRETKASVELLSNWRREIRRSRKVVCQHRPHCAFEGRSLLEMVNHRLVCSVIRRNLHSCKLCPFRIESYAAMYLHVTKWHSPAESVNQPKEVLENTYLYDLDIKIEPDLGISVVQSQLLEPVVLHPDWWKKLIIKARTDAVSKEMKQLWDSQLKSGSRMASCLNAPACQNQQAKISAIVKHQRACSVKKREVYFCKICNVHSFVHRQMVEHVSVHKMMVAKQTSEKKDDGAKEMELQKKVLGPVAHNLKHIGNFQRTTKEWMLEFTAKYNSTAALFPDYKCDDNSIRFLSPPEVDATRPKIDLSMRFAHTLHNTYSSYSSSFDVSNWRRLGLMEASVGQQSAILFCGGPVVSMAWATFPLDYNGPEVLAVCCKNDPNDFGQLPDLKTPHKCLIQLWAFANMNNNAEVTQARLKYAIACDSGPMRDMRFCPSGGYDAAANRLGLMAAATSSGVHIYALPLCLDILDGKSQIVSLQPVEILQMDGVPATCLDWSASPARIAAGFTNGNVAVWNLDDRPSLLRFGQNGVKGLNPVNWVKAAQSAITSIKFHLSGESCYLLVTALDRRVKVYDLDTSFMPMEISSYYGKSRILAADWSPHWSAFNFGLDESLLLERCGIFLKHPHDIGERTELLMAMDSSTSAMDFNKWSNECVLVSEAGDICSVKSMQLLTGVVGKQVWKSRLVFGYTDVVDLGETKIANHLNLDYSYNDDNGIVFCDLDLAKSHSMDSLGLKTLRSRTIIGFPFSRINRVRFNENQQAHSFYALGYQAGFVRIKKLQKEKA